MILRKDLLAIFLAFSCLSCGKEEKGDEVENLIEILSPENRGSYEGTEIGVMIVYPSPSATQFAKVQNNLFFNPEKISTMPSYIASIIQRVNEVYKKSGVNIFLKTKHLQSLDFSSYGALWQKELVLALMNASTSTDDSHKAMLDVIYKLQESYQADLVMLWRGYNDGISFVNGAAEISCSKKTCLSQFNYFSFPDVITVAHELGHLMGARHEHGFVQDNEFAYVIEGQSVTDRFATIMSTTNISSTTYNSTMTRVYRFSSASQTLSEAETCSLHKPVSSGGVSSKEVACKFPTQPQLGDNSHDVVSILNNFRETLASYY